MTLPHDDPAPTTAPVRPEAQAAILSWFDRNGRDLPFRAATDPYAILVSEAMAQQTQAARAGEAWTRFMDRFPNVHALADASVGDVLRAWQGLGYNRRAVALHRAARIIAAEHGGRVPSDLVALEALPGVGPYTARAVLAIAFGRAVGAVDTNVRRVLGRVVAGGADALGPATLQGVADTSVPDARARDWTYALMDIGATICLPRRQACDACPIQRWCRLADSVPTQRTPSLRPRPAARAASAATTSFPATTRWLRGRIVERLRGAPDGEWVAIDHPIGRHDVDAVSSALEALDREGLLVLDSSGPDVKGRFRARLPT